MTFEISLKSKITMLRVSSLVVQSCGLLTRSHVGRTSTLFGKILFKILNSWAPRTLVESEFADLCVIKNLPRATWLG